VPTYEYQCDKCQRVFEVRQRISEPSLTTCDACGGAVKRLLSAAPFILKGGGWYVTDYPSESRKKAVESEKSATKSNGDGGGDKSAAAPGGTTGAAGSAPATPAKTESKPAPSKSD
jgi:putative FmdB family regulatory protein